MSLTKEQLARLPKFVQQEISRLEQNLEAAYAKIQAGPEGSNAWTSPYSDVYRAPIGKDPTVQYGDSDGDHFVVKWDGRRKRLDIVGYGGGLDRMVIAPRGGNCVHVAIAEMEH
jgi:hypothetical protein